MNDVAQWCVHDIQGKLNLNNSQVPDVLIEVLVVLFTHARPVLD